MNKQIQRPLRVVFFHIMRENFSGAQKNIFRLLINLNKGKIQPFLIGQVEAPLTKLTEKERIETKIISFPSGMEVFDQKLLRLNIFRILRFIKGVYLYNKKLIVEFKKINPDVIWCDNIRTFCTIYFACRISRVKIIWNIWSEPKGKVSWIVHRIGLLLSDCINLEYKKQGKKLFGNLVKFPFISKKIIPLYTGVSDFEKKTGKNIRNELSLSHNDILIIMASNIVSGKGQIDLIKSMEILLRESSRIHLLVAGTAVLSSNDSVNYFESLKHVALQNNLNKHVHFIGWRSDIRDILALSDIYVSTSYSESFPDAVREAMLESLPVVVTDVGGTCELVDEGCNGFLFQPGEIEVLTEHLKKIINNSDLRKDMGKNSLQIIKERFSTKVYAENFEVMVENLS